MGIDKYILAKQLKSSINKHMESPTKDSRKNVVYWAIKCVPHLDSSEDKEVLIQLVNMELKKMTYRDLVNMFPIEKWYDGDKEGWKDYFYTMKYIKEQGGLDSYIENPFEAVLEYQNIYVELFAVQWMHYVDACMKEQTGIDLVEAFFYTDDFAKDSKGNLIGVDNKGRVHKVENPHSTRTTLKVIK